MNDYKFFGLEILLWHMLQYVRKSFTVTVLVVWIHEGSKGKCLQVLRRPLKPPVMTTLNLDIKKTTEGQLRLYIVDRRKEESMTGEV